MRNSTFLFLSFSFFTMSSLGRAETYEDIILGRFQSKEDEAMNDQNLDEIKQYFHEKNPLLRMKQEVAVEAIYAVNNILPKKKESIKNLLKQSYELEHYLKQVE